MPNNDVCQKCQKPKQSTGGGLVTQFIEVCICDQLAREQSQTITICSNCRKRIAKNVGSITQWIFGVGKCECVRPEPLEKPIDEFVNPSFVGYRDSKNETYLELDSDKFPVERYLPIAELGRGASGIVYLSRDKILGKKVAVKTLLDLTAEQLISFQEEAKATAKLDHPNIVKILDFGASESGTPYMVMDYIPAISLQKYLETSDHLTEESCLLIFSKLAGALEYAHNQNVFHRDLKPNNILLHETEEGIDVTLIDFGIAKVKEATGLTTIYQDRTLAGTPDYMSPDPIRGDDYDARSEIYSLGCVMFESLVGYPPFRGETALETLSLHVNELPPNLIEIDSDISEPTASIVETCLQKSKENRYTSMEELKETIDSTLTGSATESTKSESTSKSLLKQIPVLPAMAIFLFFLSPLLFLLPESKTNKPQKSKNSIVVRFRSNTTKDRNNFAYEPYLSNGDISDSGLKHVAKELRKRLKQSAVDSGNLDPLIINPVAGGMAFSLDLSSWKINGSGLRYLKNLPIQKLILSKNIKLNNKYLRHLESLPLLDLEMDGTNINKIGIESIVKINSLFSLSLNLSKNITDSDLENIGALELLNTINLDRAALTDQTLKSLAKCRSLYRISMRNTEITTKGLEEIPSYIRLKYLYIGFCGKLNERTLQVLAKKYPRLILLDLSGIPINPSDYSLFSKFRSLESLYLMDNPIDDSALKVISQNKKLSLLFLGNAKITDESLLYLSKCPNLEKIYLISCPNLTEEGIENLKSRLTIHTTLITDTKKGKDPFSHYSIR